MMKTKAILRLGTLCVVLASAEVQAQQNPDLQGKMDSTLRWKYGWKDGNRNNTIGRGDDPLPAASTYLSGGYVPAQIARAYGFDLIPSTGDGRGQTIAIIVAYGSPSIQGDLDVFCTQYGLPKTPVAVYYPLGAPATNNSGWAAETTLDVEWAHAMAPGASIAVVVAPDAGISKLLSAVNYATGTLKATVVSMSWGAPEFRGESNYDGYFNKAGINFVAASGDGGAGVMWPACSPYVLGVGGTTLLYDVNAGAVVSENAWSGSGGGVSGYVQIPSYQTGWNVNAGRGVPDAGYNADPYTGFSVYFTDPSTKSGGWYVFGGTSAGAPQWAALLARRASLGNNGSSLFNTMLYGSSSTNYATLLYDVIAGSNGYPATVKYDLVSGLGTPEAPAIAAIPAAFATASPTSAPKPKRK